MIATLDETNTLATIRTAKDIMFAATYEAIFKKKCGLNNIPDILQPLETELEKMLRTEYKFYDLDQTSLIKETFRSALNTGIDAFSAQPSSIFKEFLEAKAEAIRTLLIDFRLEGGSPCSDCISWDNWGHSPVMSVMEYYSEIEHVVVPVTNLIPDSETWTAAEWLDWDFVSTEMSKRYGYNYADDPAEFDALLSTWIEARNGCVDCQSGDWVDAIKIELKHFTYDIARELWPDHTVSHIMNAFDYTKRELSKSPEEKAAEAAIQNAELIEFSTNVFAYNERILAKASVKAIQDTGIFKLVTKIKNGDDHELKKRIFADELGVETI